MINTSIHNKKLLFILIICVILFSTTFSSVGSAQLLDAQDDQQNPKLLSVNDGYLYDYDEDDRESIRAIDYSIASSEIPANSTVESELLIANYGIGEETISLKPYIVYNDEDENIVSEDKYEIKPKSKYTDITLEPGEHKLYKFDYKFLESDSEYTVSFIHSEKPENKPIISKDINIVDESSGQSGSLVIDKGKITQNKISPTSFKDENSLRSSELGSSMSLPPVEKDEDGTFELDVAVGEISDFGKMQINSDIYGSIVSDTDEINIGINTENVPIEDHYAVSILYELEKIISAEMKIVSSTGEEIDENTDYYFNNEDSIEDRIFYLSNKEINYIQTQGEVYFELDNVDEIDIFDEDEHNTKIEIYELNVIAQNEIWNIPEKEISANLNAEPNSAEVGDTIQITAEITNEGPVATNEDFELREVEALGTSQTVSIRDGEIINPGDTITKRFNVRLTTNDVHKFELFGDTVTVDVVEEESPTVSSNDKSIVEEELDTSLVEYDSSDNNQESGGHYGYTFTPVNFLLLN